MFEGEPWKNPFLNENYEKVSHHNNLLYIKIQGLKVYYTKSFASNLIDIEVVYKHKTNISGRLLVEGEQTIDTLCNSIKDMLEIFPKLSGLDGLEVINLQKKEGNEWIDLIMDNIIKNHIKQKDVIYFDLKYSDVWVEVIMTVKERNDETKTNKFSFELKKQLKKNDDEFELSLINLGIRSWKQFNEEDKDYYLLSKLEINPETKPVEKKVTDTIKQDGNQNNIEEQKEPLIINNNNNEEEKFDFNAKIVCSLIFINFTNYILNYSMNEIERKNGLINNNLTDENISEIMNNKISKIKHYFNNKFRDLYLKNSTKVIEEDKILCKISPNYFKNFEEERYSDPIIFDLYSNYNNTNNNSNNRNSNYKMKYIGPFNQRYNGEKKEIEMEEIRDGSEKMNNSMNSLKLSDIDTIRNDSENLEESSESDHTLEEIDYIENNIDFDALFNKFKDSYILNGKFNESDVLRTRNLIYLDGELKTNKINLEKDIDKKSSKELKVNTFSNEEDFLYNTRLIKKYTVILIILILLIIIAFKI